jgi:hypothetical protein
LRDYLIREVPPAGDEIATRLQVPNPELGPPPPMILEEFTIPESDLN